MIESISISKVASYGNAAQVLTGLSQFNYIYGPNGAGKTTISKVIAADAEFPTCTVKWQNGIKLKAMVYNRDFVERNFTHTIDLKGIFTLGEGHIDVEKQVAELKKQMEKVEEEVKQLNRTLGGDDGTGGKKAEQKKTEDEFKEDCWKQKLKHEAYFKDAFAGQLKKDKFRDQLLRHLTVNATSDDNLDTLKKLAETIFGEAPVRIATLAALAVSTLVAIEKNALLKKNIVGKSDVDIAAMIEKLQNSDWVQQGREFYDNETRTCPFCQQVAKESLSKSLEEYFDESFTNDIQALNALCEQYSKEIETIKAAVERLTNANCKYLDQSKLKAATDLLTAKLASNQKLLADKKKEPSKQIQLESIDGLTKIVDELINNANCEIASHNTTVDNLASEKTKLIERVWKYIAAFELKELFEKYQKRITELETAISSINKQISAKQKDYLQKVTEIRSLEKKITTIQPTIDAINALLFSYGFRGFKLAKNGDMPSYRIVRTNGDSAKETLSEGEKTFITFLYFYHLLKGSETETDIATKRIVVFDDPVSSLDSDILFIVGSLIKNVIQEVRDKKSAIQQVVVLTHNVLFHKEVTFNLKRKSGKLKEEAFWVVRKNGEQSIIEKQEKNPIQTGYELLWDEVRRDDRNIHTIQNTLRRILEYYFKVFGGCDPDEIIAKLDVADRLVCRSMFAWVNEGSHFSSDDIYVTIDHGAVQNYLRVFRMIFEKTGHLAHYEMMLRCNEKLSETLSTSLPSSSEVSVTCDKV